MKIEITDEEIKSFHEFYQREDIPMHSGIYGDENSTGEYSMNFKINNGERASLFFTALLYDKEIREYLKDKAGFEVTSLNLYASLPNSVLDELSDELNKVLDILNRNKQNV